MLGYPEAALADADQTVSDAREIGQAATLMYALTVASLIHIHCGNYATANAVIDELIALADEKGTMFWKAYGMVHQGCVLAQTGESGSVLRARSRRRPSSTSQILGVAGSDEHGAPLARSGQAG
jgi:hypothetical protein